MVQAKKLQNSFNEFLPQKFFDFRRDMYRLTANKAVVAELLRACCEETEVKAIQVVFERVIGKPEKVIAIKRTKVRTVFPDARAKALKPEVNDRVQDETRVQPVGQNKVVIDEGNAPGILLNKMIDKIGEKDQDYIWKVLDEKDKYSVAEVIVANLYGIAMRGANLGAIKLLFDYIDGAVADVVRLEGENTVMVESWADVAPFEAIKGEDGIFYLDMESVI
jgi:hypothetical protein